MFKLQLKLTGKGWETITSEKFVTPQFMEELGNALLYYIIREAKEDLNSQRNGKGQPEGIPDDPKFFESFGFDINGSSISIYSTWPQIDAIIQGKNPFPLKWLTKPHIQVVPMKNSLTRQVLFRTTPDRSNPWIHPGFSSHSFIERGVEKAFSRFETQLANQARKVFGSTPLT